MTDYDGSSDAPDKNTCGLISGCGPISGCCPIAGYGCGCGSGVVYDKTREHVVSQLRQSVSTFKRYNDDHTSGQTVHAN